MGLILTRDPVFVGGAGKTRTPSLAAHYATEFNIGFCSVEEAATQFRRVRHSCRDIGRDPKTLQRTVNVHFLMGAGNMEQLFSQPWVGHSWEGFVIEQTLATLVKYEADVRSASQELKAYLAERRAQQGTVGSEKDHLH